MSSKVISNNKENTQMVFSSVKKSNLIKSENSTKGNALKPLTEQTSELKRRRALGDVFNTTTTTLNKPAFKEDAKLNKKLSQKPQQMKTTKSLELTNEDTFDPVEKCQIHVDTFDDLFENGKISDLFVKSRVNMIPRLPSGNIASRLHDEFIQFSGINDDYKWKKELQSVNKMLRKERTCKQEELFMEADTYELPELEIPSFLNEF